MFVYMHRLLGWMMICWGIGVLGQEVKPFVQGLMLLGVVLGPLLWKKEWSRWFKRKKGGRRKLFSARTWAWRLAIFYVLMISFLEIWQVFVGLGLASCAIRIWWENRKKGVVLS
ncbi:UNVERIFIED_ORG: hypothetical protein BDK47_11829 [Anoxybacillus amylolyticus]